MAIPGLNELRAKLARLKTDIQSGALIDEAAQAWEQDYKDATESTLPEVTGELKASVQVTSANNRITIENTAEYSGVVEEGDENQTANRGHQIALNMTKDKLVKRIDDAVQRRTK